MNRNIAARNRSIIRPRWPHALAGIGLLVGGLGAGSIATRPTAAQGQIVNPAAQQRLTSGDVLSLPVLEEILATLRQMDARLAKLESVAQQMQSKRAMGNMP
jgi:hypothetical protein